MSKIRIIFIFVIFYLLIGCGQSKYPSSCTQVLKNYYELLNTAENQEKAKDIINDLNQVIKKTPQCVSSYLLIGDIYISLKNFKLAKIFFLKATNIDSNNIYALFKIGLFYEFDKNYDSAIIYFTSAADKKEVNGYVFNKGKALEVITGKPNFDIDYSDIIFNRAKANYYTNHLLDSKLELDYCIDHNNNLKEAFFFRGLIYLKIKEFEKACQDMYSANGYGNTETNEYIEKYCKKIISSPVFGTAP